VLAVAMLGFGSTGWRAAVVLAESLPTTLEGQDLLLTGVVAQMPRSSPSGTRFTFEVEEALQQGRPVAVPARVALGWYRGADADAWLSSPAQELRAGQRWRLTVRLKQPHGSLNPQGFDLELWLFEQGIRASGYVRSLPGAVNQRLADGVAHPFERARQSVRDAIVAKVADPALPGVLAALAIGDQNAIDRDDWDLFRATGIAHLMSISGLHITMFTWLAGALVNALWRRSARLMLWLPAPQAGRWGGLLLATVYSMLAGWGVPAQRTVLMIALVVLLRSRGLRWPLPVVLLAAGVGVTALDPWALLQPGFWLSFMAVALLIASEPVLGPRAAPAEGWRARVGATLRGGLRSQVIATLGLAPLSMVFFQ
jgi:competence protein ComEC